MISRHSKNQAGYQGRKTSLVTFAVGDVRYGLDVRYVQQVVNPLPVTVIPEMPPGIVGVAEYRRIVLPVVDLRIRFGVAAEICRKTKWLVIKPGRSLVGLVVDAVVGVLAAAEDDVHPAPDSGCGEKKRPLLGALSDEDGLVFLVGGVFLDELAEAAMGATDTWPLMRGAGSVR